MIVLESVHPQSRRIAVRQLEQQSLPSGDYIAALSQILIGMGERGLQIIEHAELEENGTLNHEWFLAEDGMVGYRAIFPQDRDSAASINIYSAAALATYSGGECESLMQLRLAIYELCVNVLEHGRALHEDGSVRLGLRFAADSIRGSIQDECCPFNPLEQPLEDTKAMLRRRASRGYGIRLAMQLLDELEYEYNDTGNLLRFTKRMDR